MDGLKWEIAQTAATKIVDDGMSWGLAKRHAAEDLGLPARTALPGNDLVLQAVREHIALFGDEAQAQHLLELRQLALHWMSRMSAYHPHVSGAVWLGIATQWSDVHLDLYCDDPKMPEIDLLNQGLSFDTGEGLGARGEPVPQVIVMAQLPQRRSAVAVIMTLYDANDLRGALKPGASGEAPRGDAKALRQRIDAAQEMG
jgi:hypothetical protein